MADSRAETFYIQTPDTTVSSTRAVLNGVTYAMANVTSVRMVTLPADMLWLLFLLLGLIALAVGVVFKLLLVIVFGLLMVGVGIIVKLQAKPTYVVVLGTAGGDAHAQHSKDKAHITAIVDALSMAIINRG